ncbi:MAG: hypothetical protein M5U19_02810 [Microthrixaceae bacterium]|nr:hypothetical protein [Microthrixaceae bacterium]
MAELFSPHQKIVLERRLWIAVMRSQAALGVDIPETAIQDYENVVDQVDESSIAQRERITRHDVKARLEEFSALAGHEYAHMAMTSRSDRERRADAGSRRPRSVAHEGGCCAGRLAALAVEHRELVVVGRSHNVAAQATTLGKRFANAGQELLVAFDGIEDLIGRYPLRGLKGPVGTQQDQLDLLGATRRAWPDLSAAWRHILASRRCSTTWDRSTRGRWTSTWSPAWSSSCRLRRRSPRRSGSWRATSS